MLPIPHRKNKERQRQGIVLSLRTERSERKVRATQSIILPNGQADRKVRQTVPQKITAFFVKVRVKT